MAETSETSSVPDKASNDLQWWRSVRFRFGLLLALALLPWLVLTGVDAFNELDRNRVSQSRLNDVIAASRVDEVGRTLEAGRFGLEAMPQLIADLGCEVGVQTILNRLDVYTAAIVRDPDAKPVCQSPESLDSLVVIGPDPFEDGENFRIERGELTQDDDTQPVVILQRRFPSTGRIYTLVLPKTLGMQNFLNVTLGEGSSVSLTKPSGQGIVGATSSPEKSSLYRDQIGDAEVSFLDYQNVQDESRRAAARYYPYLDLYVSVTRDANSKGENAFINPYTSILLPILAWLIGFGLIWMGTQGMLLTPISKLRRMAARYASGQFDKRVDLSDAAAAEVQALGLSFNQMAEELEARASRIAANMDEKDVLMREIHHRVKNNLQIIISLLNMQARKAKTEDAVAAISETRTRINAIATVHRGLYESDDMKDIDLQTFISRLIGALSDSMGMDEADIRLNHSVESARLSADDAIPVALFIVEAISDALNRGVESGGTITVSIKNIPDNQLQIDVHDTGPDVDDVTATGGIGTRLMHGFARQLSGKLEFLKGTPGLTARLVIPLSVSEDKSFQVSRKRR